VAAVHGEAERRRVKFAGARVGKPVWHLKGLIERLQSCTGSRGDELKGRRGAGTAEVDGPR
jgi:hypothetical protein